MSQLIFERSVNGRRGIRLPEYDCPEVSLNDSQLRSTTRAWPVSVKSM
jgi:hypothetical protein